MTLAHTESDADRSMSAILLDQADRLFAGEVTRGRLTASDRGEWQADLWRATEEAGLMLAMTPEAQGGIGLSAADGFALIRRAAYHTVPLPIGESMVANALWSKSAEVEPAGAMTIAPDTISLIPENGAFRLDGHSARIPWAAQVDRILAAAADPAGRLHLVAIPTDAAPGTDRVNLANEPRRSIDFRGVVVPADAVRPIADARAGHMKAIGAAIRAQQMVGAMERAMDHALSHANDRKQFGKPIAKFQAVQHMLAEAAGHYAAATAAADLAVEAFDGAGMEFAVAVAKSRTGEAAGKVAEICHQVHGAMGFTQEHLLHFATRRLWSWRDEFGNEAYWQLRVGRIVCGQGGEALWPMLTDA